MTPVIDSLPVVVLYPHSRCNCRCIMCDIWDHPGRREVSDAEFSRYLEEFRSLSVRWVVLSGGEPLMHSDLFPFCARLKESGIRVTILSTGLLLERDAARIVETVDDVIVSLDGPGSLHDDVRRIRGAFAKLVRGVEAIHRLAPAFAVSARSVVQRANFRSLRATARAARAMGLCSISFLAADLTSTAFNRPEGWDAPRQATIALAAEELPELESELAALMAEFQDDPFLADSPAKLARIALHYRAHLGLAAPEAPRCNAPWVSAVVEADGAVRPCFFHQPIGSAAEGLRSALNSPEAVAFRSRLDVSTNEVCRRCVCSLNWG